MRKTTPLITALGAIFGIALSTALSAEVNCPNHNTQITPSTPSEAFEHGNGGTTRHNRTGLVWMRCAVGQEWDTQQETCQGDATVFTWQEALQAAQAANEAESPPAGYQNWRLPNRSELESILEDSCWNPALNTAVFPNPPIGWFWTSTPGRIAEYSWGVNFNGANSMLNHRSAEENYNYVRLVRDPTAQ